MTHQEEQTIISSVLSGNTAEFEKLVDCHQKKVYNLTLKMTKNVQDALDLSQDAFLKAYVSLKDFRGDSSFSSWLYKLTYNICIDFLRKKQRGVVIPLTRVDEDGETNELEIPDTRYLPEDELERRELRKAAYDAIDSLALEHRQILIMREFTGMSYKAIADSLYINEGTVKSRIARARRALAKILISNGTFSAPDRHKTRKEDADNE